MPRDLVGKHITCRLLERIDIDIGNILDDPPSNSTVLDPASDGSRIGAAFRVEIALREGLTLHEPHTLDIFMRAAGCGIGAIGSR